MRRLLNVSNDRQQELASIYPWLHSVDEGEEKNVQMLSVSVFDHWLTREQACVWLENTPPKEQLRRDALHAAFCNRIAHETEVLSFVFRRRQRNRLVFRKFTSNVPLLAYCTPHGGKTLNHRRFHVVLPDLHCAYYESRDDTNHFYFTEPALTHSVVEWANECGLHIHKASRSK